MEYANITEAMFLCRPNRFLATVFLNGREETVHVKNTGRLKELFVPGARVLLSRGDTPGRKTVYDLVSVYHGKTLVNVDSQAPNKIAEEYLRTSLAGLTELRAEAVCGGSRFDFYGIREGRPFYLEIKGVTLVRNGVAFFPDAPTERGLKHIRELTDLKRIGTDTGVLFIIQRDDATVFSPSRDTQAAFAEALLEAEAAGVDISAVNCSVAPGRVKVGKKVRVMFQ